MRAVSYITILLFWFGWSFAQNVPQLPQLPGVPDMPQVPTVPDVSMPQRPPRGVSVQRRPAQNEYPNVIVEGKGQRSVEPWIVYSDRSDNVTYSQPGGIVKLNKIGMMERCYVINARDGFLELVKYDPSILGGKLFPRPRRISDRTKAVYYGWVDKSKLLLTNNAYVDSSTLVPQRYLTVLKSPQSIRECAKWLHKDSIKVWVSPSVMSGIRGYLGFQQYVYVYKYSPDRQFCLVGKSAQFITDGVNGAIFGWVSAALLQEWGSKLYFDLKDRLGKDVSFYTTEDERVKNKIDHLIGPAWEDVQSQGKIAPWCVQLPVRGKMQQDGHTFIKTELPITLYDKSKRSVFGIDGNTITYADYNQIANAAKAYNIVFAIEGNKRMAGVFPYLSNIFQTIQNSFNNLLPGARVSYGIVAYTNMEVASCKIRQRVTDVLPLTTKPESITEYLLSMTSRPLSCDTRDNGASAMYAGLSGAASLLAGHRGENNIIVLIGCVGNASEDASELVSRIGGVNAKLLSFQARNIYFSSANDFVLQSQNLILQSAGQVAYAKRKKLVSLQDIKENQVFKEVNTLKNVFFLDYPNQSMVQGGLMFPEKGKNMAVRFLQSGIDTLLKQTVSDNNHITSSLYNKLMSVGVQGEPFNPLVIEDLEQQGFDRSSNHDGDCFKNDGFIYTKSVATTIEDKVYKLVLSSDEYNELLQNMQSINGHSYDLRKHATRRHIYKDLVDKIKEAQSHSRQKLAIDNMRIADALGLIIGCPVKNKVLQLYSVGDLRNEKKLDANKLAYLVKYLQTITQNMIDHADQNKFLSGDMGYYIFSSEELP